MAKRLGILLLFGAAVFLAVSAYWLLFTTYMGYDDEGYILISLKNYSDHGGLYAQVYSQYGPFFYLFHDLGHRLLGYAFTNTNGRFVTLACWMATATTCAYLVWQQTRALFLTFFTLALTFFYLSLMIREPVHPGGVIAVLVALGACCGAKFIERNSMRSLAIMSGLIGAALLLTKINVGVFFLAASGTWFVVNLRNSRHARIGSIVAGILLLLLPISLMHGELREEWCRIFAILSVVANVTMMAACWRDRQALTTWRNAAWGGATLVLFGATILGTVCLRGTTLHEMLDGILLAPLRHPEVYHFPPNWRSGGILFGTISISLIVLYAKGRNTTLCWVLLGLRLILVVEMCLASAEWLSLTSHSSVMTYAMPLAWIFVVRISRQSPIPASPNIQSQSWIGLILVLQYLHAYPVAGTQIAWGTFLIVPLMALGLHDTQLFLKEQGHKTLVFPIGAGAIILAALPTLRLCKIGWDNYEGSQPLLLPGADDVRPPAAFAGALRVMALNATAHGDMLFTLPGMFSFNEWTQLPTPTLNNTTHWFSLLSIGQQQEICDALGNSRRPVLIVQKFLLNYLQENKFPVSGPLYNYLKENFVPVFELNGFEFQVKRGRIIAPLDLAVLLKRQVLEHDASDYRIEMVVAIPERSKIAKIELATLEDRPRTLFRWDATQGPLLSTAINLRGEALTAETSSAWMHSLPALVRLDLPLSNPPPIDPRNNVLYLRDASGMLLAEARFTD